MAEAGKRVFLYYGMGTGNTQVGEWRCAEAGDAGTETVNAQFGILPRAGAMSGIGLGAAGRGGGGREKIPGAGRRIYKQIRWLQGTEQ